MQGREAGENPAQCRYCNGSYEPKPEYCSIRRSRLSRVMGEASKRRFRVGRCCVTCNLRQAASRVDAVFSCPPADLVEEDELGVILQGLTEEFRKAKDNGCYISNMP